MGKFWPGRYEVVKLTHLDERGRPKMVDVGAKEPTRRVAIASGCIRMKEETLGAIMDQKVPKGNVQITAQLAGIQGAKRTADLIPLCHPLSLTSVEVEVEPDPLIPGVRIWAKVEAVDRTGVEMEALTAVSIASLTVYDMCKALDKDMTIGEIRLESKAGGRSGNYRRG